MVAKVNKNYKVGVVRRPCAYAGPFLSYLHFGTKSALLRLVFACGRKISTSPAPLPALLRDCRAFRCRVGSLCIAAPANFLFIRPRRPDVLPSSANGHARLACSLASAVAVNPLRIQVQRQKRKISPFLPADSWEPRRAIFVLTRLFTLILYHIEASTILLNIWKIESCLVSTRLHFIIGGIN